MTRTIEKRRGIIQLIAAVALSANLLCASDVKPTLSEMQSTVNSFLKNHGQKEYQSYLQRAKDYKMAYDFIQVCGKDGSVRMEQKQDPKNRTRELLVHCTSRQLDRVFNISRKTWKEIREEYPRSDQYAIFYGNYNPKMIAVELKKSDERARKTSKFENLLILGNSVFRKGKYKGKHYSYIHLQLRYLDENGSEILPLRFIPLMSEISQMGDTILMNEQSIIRLSKDQNGEKILPDINAKLFKIMNEKFTGNDPSLFQEAWGELTPKQKFSFLNKMFSISKLYSPIAGEMLNDTFLKIMVTFLKPLKK